MNGNDALSLLDVFARSQQKSLLKSSCYAPTVYYVAVSRFSSKVYSDKK